jgi:hypothetical protein
MAAAGGGRRRWQGAEPIRRAGGADERTALVPAAAMGMGGVAVAKESAEEQVDEAEQARTWVPVLRLLSSPSDFGKNLSPSGRHHSRLHSSVPTPLKK